MVEVYTVERLVTRILMKRNLKALLRHRGKKQGELARFVRRKGHDDKDADSWISHILDERSDRELPMEYWDRAAEFLGVDTYHFFLPGVAANQETERRSGHDRRKRGDRRIGQALPDRPRDLDLMNVIRAIPDGYLDKAGAALMKVLDESLQRRLTTPVSPDGPARTGESAAAIRAQDRAPKRKNE